MIEEAWNTRLVEAEQQGKMLFAGRLCRLVEYTVHENALHLTLGPTDYRELLGTNLSHPELLHTLGPAYLSNALAVHAVVSGTDEKIIIFKRSPLVAEYPNYYDVCGGHVEPDFDWVENKPDPFGAITREIREEMGISSEEIQNIVCLGLVRNTKTLKLDLIFSVLTSQPSSSFLNTPLGEEHVDIELIDDNEASITQFLHERHGSIAPAGEACLTLLLSTK